jgi:hypothetical protein
MSTIPTKTLFDIQELRIRLKPSNTPNQTEWSEDEQLDFIARVVRSAVPNGVFRETFPPIDLLRLQNTNTGTEADNLPYFEVLKKCSLP